MIKDELLERATDFVVEYVSPSIVYLQEHSDHCEFICVPNGIGLPRNRIALSEEVTKILGIPAEIIDIRAYSLYEITEIVTKSEPLYALDEMYVKVFTAAAIASLHKSFAEKQNMLERKKMHGSYYMQ